jgi:hypothetical protein
MKAIIDNLKMFCVADSNDGSTFVIATDEAQALGLFGMHEGFEDWSFSSLEVKLVDAGAEITLSCEDDSIGPWTKNAEQWCNEKGKGVFCSSWWDV